VADLPALQVHNGAVGVFSRELFVAHGAPRCTGSLTLEWMVMGVNIG
jgi:hypothetical protein